LEVEVLEVEEDMIMILVLAVVFLEKGEKKKSLIERMMDIERLDRVLKLHQMEMKMMRRARNQ
jgi:hypothetical protein